MPAVTYFHDFEIPQYQAALRWRDRELADLLDEVMQFDGLKWFAVQYQSPSVNRMKLFRHKPTPTLYELYVQTVGMECQVINFPGGESSINHTVERHMVMTYLYGRIGGLTVRKMGERE